MIYAIHRATKEHRALLTHRDHAAINSNMEWHIIDADAAGWIEWHGGNLPLPREQPVECKIVGDKKVKGQACEMPFSSCSPVWRVVAYRPILDDKPQATEWNGEGLPPVGTVCECSLDFNEGKNSSNWNKIEVLYSDESTVVGRIIEGCHAPSFSNGFETNVYDFRPIRTDREQWIEAAMKESMVRESSTVWEGALGRIYDALQNGDLPMPEVKP